MFPLVFGLGPQEILILSVIGIFALIPVIAIIDIVTSHFKGFDKVMWVLIVLFLPFAGALIYLAIGRKQRISGKDDEDLFSSD